MIIKSGSLFSQNGYIFYSDGIHVFDVQNGQNKHGHLDIDSNNQITMVDQNMIIANIEGQYFYQWLDCVVSLHRGPQLFSLCNFLQKKIKKISYSDVSISFVGCGIAIFSANCGKYALIYSFLGQNYQEVKGKRALEYSPSYMMNNVTLGPYGRILKNLKDIKCINIDSVNSYEQTFFCEQWETEGKVSYFRVLSHFNVANKLKWLQKEAKFVQVSLEKCEYLADRLKDCISRVLLAK